MEIAIFTHNYPKDKNDRKNAGIFVHDFVEKLSKFDKTHVFYPKISDQQFGRWSIFNPISILKFFLMAIKGSYEAFVFLRSKKVDYILCAWAIPSGIFAYFVNIFKKVPYGIWYLGSDLNKYSQFPILGTFMKMFAKNAKNLYANSYSLKNKVENLYHKKCIMLPASTIVSYKNINAKKINKKIINILYVGRLEKVKGPDLLLESCREMKGKYNFVLRMIGDGIMMDKIKKYIDNNDLVNNVILLGNRGLDEIGGFMKSSDFLVIPSRNESMPLVMIEAANFRLPMLVNNVGDCGYVIKKYSIGGFFEKDFADFLENKTFKKYKKDGRFKCLLLDYSLEKSVKNFLRSIK